MVFAVFTHLKLNVKGDQPVFLSKQINQYPCKHGKKNKE